MPVCGSSIRWDRRPRPRVSTVRDHEAYRRTPSRKASDHRADREIHGEQGRKRNSTCRRMAEPRRAPSPGPGRRVRRAPGPPVAAKVTVATTSSSATGCSGAVSGITSSSGGMPPVAGQRAGAVGATASWLEGRRGNHPVEAARHPYPVASQLGAGGSLRRLFQVDARGGQKLRRKRRAPVRLAGGDERPPAPLMAAGEVSSAALLNAPAQFDPPRVDAGQMRVPVVDPRVGEVEQQPTYVAACRAAGQSTRARRPSPHGLAGRALLLNASRIKPGKLWK